MYVIKKQAYLISLHAVAELCNVLTIEQITWQAVPEKCKFKKPVYTDSPISWILMIQVPWSCGKSLNTVSPQWFNEVTVKYRRNNNI
jgi:hypothetical protein